MINKIEFTYIYIKCALKNTIITLTNKNKTILKQWSSKSLKKNLFRKNNPYNLKIISNKINKYIYLKKLKNIIIFINGKGIGRSKIINNLLIKKSKIINIIDNTVIPFNGCRKKKIKRR